MKKSKYDDYIKKKINKPNTYSQGYVAFLDMMGFQKLCKDESCERIKAIIDDIESGVYKGRYTKNPTAKNLTDMINGNYIGSKTTNESGLPYVIDMNGNIIVGKRSGNGRGLGALPTPHPTLIGGNDPQVQMAGLLKIGGGKILSYDNNSGHYKPNAKSMSVADEAFSKLPATLFSKKFKRRNK